MECHNHSTSLKISWKFNDDHVNKKFLINKILILSHFLYRLKMQLSDWAKILSVYFNSNIYFCSE